MAGWLGVCIACVALGFRAVPRGVCASFCYLLGWVVYSLVMVSDGMGKRDIMTVYGWLFYIEFFL